MWILTDYEGVQVSLSQERWNHVIEKHPEMGFRFEEVKQTIEQPEVVYQSDVKPTQFRYYRYFEDIYGGIFVLVIIIKDPPDNFVVTAYLTSQIKEEGKLKWMSIKRMG